MKKKLYIRPVSVVVSVEMYQQIAELTNQQEISVSDYIREAIQEKLTTESNRTGGLNHEKKNSSHFGQFANGTGPLSTAKNERQVEKDPHVQDYS